MARDARDGQAGFGREPQALVREARLAEPGPAGDQDAAGAGILERGGDGLDLVGATEQRPRRDEGTLARRGEGVEDAAVAVGAVGTGAAGGAAGTSGDAGSGSSSSATGATNR